MYTTKMNEWVKCEYFENARIIVNKCKLTKALRAD